MRTVICPLWSSACIVAASLAIQTPARAQDAFGQAVEAAKQATFEQRPHFGGLTQYAWLSQMWSVNTFYAGYRGSFPNQTTFWVIRRVTGRSESAGEPQWADSRRCTAVEAVLLKMEQLPAVRPDAPRLGVETQNLSIVTDGTNHRFWNRWARSGEDDVAVGLEIQGNVNSPVAQWWGEASVALDECWSETEPAG